MSLIDEKTEQQVQRQEVIELGRVIRERRNLSLKKPVKMVLALHENKDVLDGLGDLKQYIMSDSTVPQSSTVFYGRGVVVHSPCRTDNRALGKKFGGESKKLGDGIRKLDREQCKQFVATERSRLKVMS